jgi:transposase
MFYGLDIHKQFIEVAGISAADAPVKVRSRVETTIAGITEFAEKLSQDDQVVLESTTHAVPVANLFRKYVDHVAIANPMKVRLIAESKVKTDKIDAEVLARLLASKYLPMIWEPDQALQDMRKITAHSNALTRQMTAQKNAIHAILFRNLVEYSQFTDLFGLQGRDFLRTVELPEGERFQIDQRISVLEDLERKRKETRERMARLSYQDEDIERLMTLPGIDYFTALTLKAAIGQIERFQDPRKLVSYLGLNPRMYQSGNSCYTGSITKQGSSQARWVLIQAVQIAVRRPGPLRAFFLRLKSRKPRNKAIVASAAKLAHIIWHMLKNKEDYYYSPPVRTGEKLRRLKAIASGLKTLRGRRDAAQKLERAVARKADDYALAETAEKEYKKFVKERYQTKKTD